MPVVFCHFPPHIVWFVDDFLIQSVSGGGGGVTKNKDLSLLTAVSLVIQYVRSAAKKIGHFSQGEIKYDMKNNIFKSTSCTVECVS